MFRKVDSFPILRNPLIFDAALVLSRRHAYHLLEQLAEVFHVIESGTIRHFIHSQRCCGKQLLGPFQAEINDIVNEVMSRDALEQFAKIVAADSHFVRHLLQEIGSVKRALMY